MLSKAKLIGAVFTAFADKAGNGMTGEEFFDLTSGAAKGKYP